MSGAFIHNQPARSGGSAGLLLYRPPGSAVPVQSFSSPCFSRALSSVLQFALFGGNSFGGNRSAAAASWHRGSSTSTTRTRRMSSPPSRQAPHTSAPHVSHCGVVGSMRSICSRAGTSTILTGPLQVPLAGRRGWPLARCPAISTGRPCRPSPRPQPSHCLFSRLTWQACSGQSCMAMCYPRNLGLLLGGRSSCGSISRWHGLPWPH